MDIITFNNEISKLFKDENHPVILYLKEEMRKHHFHPSYYGFFDSFLFKYGIISIGALPSKSKNKYVPFVNCSERNIFREQKGFTFLSKQEFNKTESGQFLAKYLINCLKNLQASNFRNWDSNLNYGVSD